MQLQSVKQPGRHLIHERTPFHRRSSLLQAPSLLPTQVDQMLRMIGVELTSMSYSCGAPKYNTNE
eukprot:6319921-Pyramimonas_sp.AAC.2